jgi:hypothetical protein
MDDLAGKQWAINELRLLARHLSGSDATHCNELADDLETGDPIAVAMLTAGMLDAEAAILQAALTADALTHVLAPLQAQVNALGARTMELDDRTLGSRSIR